MFDHADHLVRQITRRRLLRGSLLTAVVPLLAACGQSPAQQSAAQTPPANAGAAPTAAPKPAAAATAQPVQQAPAAAAANAVTLKYLTWWWAETGRNDAWRAVGAKFHAAQKDIRIQEVGFPFSEFFQRVTTQLAGGKLDADVLSFDDVTAVRLMQTGVLEPLDDVVAKLGLKDKLDKPTHDFVTQKGKLYGLLGTNVPYALIYNKDLYDKAGISKPPNTPDEVLQVAKQLTNRPDQFGFAGRNTMQEQNGWMTDLSHWVLGYGGQWTKAKKPLVTEEPVIKAIKAYKQLYDEAIPQGADASTYRRMAWEGKVAQYIDNSANINILKTGNPDIYSKIFTAPPPWQNRQAITIPNYVGTYSGSTNKDAARTWWEFVYKPENFGPLMEAALDIYPAYQGVPSEQYLKALHWKDGYLASKGTPLPAMVDGLEANVAEVRQIVLGKVSEVLTSGRAPEDAMAEAQKALEELAARV
jgi:multiple sugar transport system substrate-binding protein